MGPPKTIFKYEPFALRAIQNLKASSIYFGSPASFNDPYDCALTASIASVDEHELKQLITECASSDAYPEAIRREMPSLSLKEAEARIRRGAQLAIDEIRHMFLTTKGVTCFSGINNNLLMWSHYGGAYRGYCLEFRTDFEPFNKLQKVIYTDEMPQFHIRDVALNINHHKIQEMFCTKSSAWSYEEEWRAIHNEAGTSFTYSREALKAIYFGPDISPQDRDLICNIAYCQFPATELWIGTRSDEQFKVDFEMNSDYLPYSEAVRRGVIEP